MTTNLIIVADVLASKIKKLVLGNGDPVASAESTNILAPIGEWNLTVTRNGVQILCTASIVWDKGTKNLTEAVIALEDGRILEKMILLGKSVKDTDRLDFKFTLPMKEDI